MQAAYNNSSVDLTMLAALLATSITEPIHSPANLKLKAMTQVLSQRQQEVLELLANGCQTARIAERLNISEAAVNKHFSLARKALGASTREQALAIALKENLINL
jgi:DNA-binding NarL/FixJ family response regulator